MLRHYSRVVMLVPRSFLFSLREAFKVNNRIFLIVTQYKKLGTLVEVSRNNPVNPFTSSNISVGILFGVDNTYNLLAARYIAEVLAVDRPMLAAISLKEYCPEVLKAITTVLLTLKSW